MSKPKQRNHVQQYSWDLNKSQVHVDKKKQLKKGKRKHKGKDYE